MTLGKLLVITGVALVAAGLLFLLFERAGVRPLGWFGRLPGDVRIEREGVRFYFPVVSCLLLSALVSLVLWLLRR